MSKTSKRRPRDPRYCSQQQFDENWQQALGKKAPVDEDIPIATMSHEELDRRMGGQLGPLESLKFRGKTP